MGITAKLGRNLSLSLGSSELSMEELARAYGVFPAKGVLFPTVYVTKIVNRKGEVIYDYQQEKLQVAKQVISENSAFIMAHMMKGVVENGTAMKIKEIGRPVAGKTGTSNDQMDAWFIGYTPEWVTAIWVGFDQKKDLGDKETGGKVAVPIWLDFMRAFLDDRDKRQQESLNAETKAEAERLGIHYQAPPPPEPADFSVPEGVDPFWVDKKSGLLAERGAPGAILEYFLRGTEPNHSAINESANGYLNSPEL